MANNPSSKSPARSSAPGSLVIEVVHRVGGKEFPNAVAAQAYIKQMQEESEEAVRRKFVGNIIARTADRKRADVRPGVEHLFNMLLTRPDLLRDLNTLAADGSRSSTPVKKAAAPKPSAPKPAAVAKKPAASKPVTAPKPVTPKPTTPAVKKPAAPKQAPKAATPPAGPPVSLDAFPPPSAS